MSIHCRLGIVLGAEIHQGLTQYFAVKEPRILRGGLLVGKHREIWGHKGAPPPVLGSGVPGKALLRRNTEVHMGESRSGIWNLILKYLS